MPLDEGNRLIGDLDSLGPHEAELSYDYKVNCEYLLPVALVYAAYTVLWVSAVFLWIMNTFKWNADNSSLFHRLLFSILIFKLINVFSAFCYWFHCPFTLKTNAFLKLLRDQSRTLYETAFFTLLIVLSRGIFIIRDEFSRNEFNSLAGSISVIYILDSGYNVMGADMDGVILALYIGIYVICLYGIFQTCRMLRSQDSVVTALNVPDMREAVTTKRGMFCRFIATMQGYFGFECLVHMVMGNYTAIFTSRPNIQYCIWIGVHEAFELFFIGLIFFVYRAKDRGRFFDYLQDDEPPVNAVVVPYYKARTEPNGNLSDAPLLLVMPGFDPSTPGPLQNVSLGMSTANRPRVRSSAREVELQVRH
mmetsp:Transcript_1735/g.3694  ORF Transcript_1735/g.3694 Transcript_1735/m.3694 type:complete len:363 (+) Transcript_1735:412-1500(+)